MREVIRSFGKTVLLVSHDRDEVYRMADRIAVMKNGKIEVIGDKKEVFAAPHTKNAAMLTGCKNISRMEKLGGGRVFATDWQLELCTRGGEENASFIGIRMHDIRMGDGENSVYCDIAEVIENPFSVTFMLRPEGAENAMPIGWETDKSKLSMARHDKIWVSLPPDCLLLLEDDDV
jgi:molybdate transport system ATP-binding protein